MFFTFTGTVSSGGAALYVNRTGQTAAGHILRVALGIRRAVFTTVSNVFAFGGRHLAFGGRGDYCVWRHGGMTPSESGIESSEDNRYAVLTGRHHAFYRLCDNFCRPYGFAAFGACRFFITQWCSRPRSPIRSALGFGSCCPPPPPPPPWIRLCHTGSASS